MVITWKGELFRKLLKKYFYFKMCYSRAGSYIDMPIEVAKYVGGAAVFLKVFEFDNYHLLMLCGLLYVVFRAVWGNMDIKRKWAHIEASIRNQINPEFMETHKNTKLIKSYIKNNQRKKVKRNGIKKTVKEQEKC